MMTLQLVTPPVEEPVTLAEAKAHLRVDHDDEDALIGGLIVAARQHLDGRDGRLGRALVSQTWDYVADGFGRCIELPLPPVQSVTSIGYRDADGMTQTLAADQYEVTRTDGWGPAVISPVSGVSWPSGDQVAVRFVAGYGDAEDVPAPIKQAILLLVGHWYEQRAAVVAGVTVAPVPMAVDALLAPYRVWGF